jgi:hypothetical protein
VHWSSRIFIKGNTTIGVDDVASTMRAWRVVDGPIVGIFENRLNRQIEYGRNAIREVQ